MNYNNTPTSTVTPARVRVFQATKVPVATTAETIITTAWGTCTVEGRLGQRHADLVESILYLQEKRKDNKDGTFGVRVDPYKLRQCLGKQYSHEQLSVLLKEIRKVVITIETPKFKIMGGIIDSTSESKSKDAATVMNPLTGQRRHKLVVKFSAPFCEMLKLDVPLFYNPKPLCRLTKGISKAVARHILTHQHAPQGGWKLDDVIRVVAGDIKKTDVRNHRRSIKADAAVLAEAGISIINGRLIRE